MKPEPIEFIQDHDGSIHFAHESLPYKTVINPQALPFRWAKVDETKGAVIITLDGRTVIYDRVATGLHGEWICALRIGNRDADERDAG